MNCSDFRQWILDFSYGELDGTKQDRMRDHAGSCLACRERLIDLDDLRQLLDEFAEQAPIAESTLAADKLFHNHRPRRRGRFRWAVMTATAATLALILTLVFVTRVESTASQLSIHWRFAKPAADSSSPLHTAGAWEELRTTIRNQQQQLREQATLLALLADQRLSDRQRTDQSVIRLNRRIGQLVDDNESRWRMVARQFINLRAQANNTTTIQNSLGGKP